MQKMFLWLLSLLLWVVCNPEKPAQETEAQELARSYCVGCHLLPQLTDLDRLGWEKALGWMGSFMGVYKSVQERRALLGAGAERERLLKARRFPEQPMIAEEDFRSH